MPLQIVRNDITKIKADAIVNAANQFACVGTGVDLSIYNAAGYEALLRERKKIGTIEPGECMPTSAFNLDAMYIIHTVGTYWEGGCHGEEAVLRNCYRNSLKMAKHLKCGSVAIPLMATGNYCYPKELAFGIAQEEIEAFLKRNDILVILVIFDRECLTISQKRFDDIKEYIDNKYVEEHKSPMDFFSWHSYTTTGINARWIKYVNENLEKAGYGDAEVICDEWNYVTGWASSESEYSSDTRRSIKGAAFTAAVMSVGQNSPLDMMMYYDLRPTTSYDGVFNHETGDPKCGYYAFLSWAKLTRLGTQVAVSGDAFSTAAAAPAASSAAGSDPSEVGSASKASSESKGCPDVYVTAAKSPDGRIGILVTRYNDDDRIHTREAVTVEVKGYDMSKAVCHMTNNDFLGTEYPFSLSKGRLLCNMTPNSFMFIELPAAE